MASSELSFSGERKRNQVEPGKDSPCDSLTMIDKQSYGQLKGISKAVPKRKAQGVTDDEE